VLAAGSLLACLRAAAGRGEVLRVPREPVTDDAAGLRAANVRLRELLAERDARIEEALARLAAVGEQVAQLRAAGRGPGGTGGEELEEQLEAAVLRRASEHGSTYQRVTDAPLHDRTAGGRTVRVRDGRI
jgi:hypothetical protein